MKNKNTLFLCIALAATTISSTNAFAQGCVAAHSNQRPMDQLIKSDGGGAIFYSVVARDSLDAEYAAHRQRFLAEQGYGYIIRDADDLLGPAI